MLSAATDLTNLTNGEFVGVVVAGALANYAERKGINEDYIIPRMDETEACIEEAVAVVEEAMRRAWLGEN